MKETGMVRPIDTLGRVVIPIEIRRSMDIKSDDSVEIYVDGDRIVLKKYEPACIFCGKREGIRQIKGKNVCQSCIDQMKNL